MPKTFAGFSADYFEFFSDLSKNNNRQWFQDNKARYTDDVLNPLSSFVSAMGPRLAKISTRYVADPRPNGRSIFRIYKDMRFAKNGKPYKEHGACQFRHEAGKDAHAPGYYVHLAGNEVVFGGGIWKPPGAELRKIREAINDNPDDWGKVAGDKGLKAVFGGISGDGLSRPPRGFDADTPYLDDIKRQSFFAMRHGDPQAARAPAFIDDVTAAFEAATPLMRFLCKALGVPF